MRKIYVITRMTYREAVRQPLFWIIIFVSIALLFLAPLFSLFSFGEELSMVREAGLATIIFAGLLIVVLTSASVITTEIEKLTVLTLLSKPVRRSEFIIGKFLGILLAAAEAVIILLIFFILIYWLKETIPCLNRTALEGRYLEDLSLFWNDAFKFMLLDATLLIKGVYVSFLQIIIMTAFAVVLSSQFTLVITGVGSLAIFILGHISNYIVSGLESINFIVLTVLGKILSLILPNLTNLNVSSLVATQTPISFKYLLLATLYGLVYSGLILILTIVLFSRREMK